VKLPALFIAFLLAAPLPAPAQISTLKKALAGQEAPKTEAPEKPEDNRKRLEQWQQEARETLDRLEASGTSAALPGGVTTAELEERRRDLEQMILITASALKNLNSLSEARKAAESARAVEAAWTGFKEAPPYSIIMIDELLNERDAIKATLVSHESSLANYEVLLANTLAEAKSAEDAVNGMIATVQNAGDGQADAAKWRLDAARAASRLLAARAGFIQSSCAALNDRLAAARAELSLVERKIKTASPHARFSDEDISKLEKIAAERRKAIEKENTAVSKRLKTAMAARTQAQSALDSLLATATDGKDPDGLELAKFRVEVAEGRVESLQSMTEGLESLVQLEGATLKSYQDRRTLLTAKNPEERNKALDSIRLLSDRFGAWLNVIENELATCGADLSKIESRAASITTEDPRFPLLNEQRAARSEKLAILQRASQAVSSQRKLLNRWIADYSPKPGETGFFERLSSLAARTLSAARKIWSYEVMNFEEKVVVEGQTITGRLPVTLGMLLRALLFFVIGYWISARIANRIQKTVVSHGHIAEAQAKTLRNWAMIVVGLALVLGTLSFLKIPLTVFAFFGGALAIGIGFGTQTLIKNFISGIIVLVERKVRVGDILDVDGVVGTVTEVNTRSSVIRSPDDVETMIPNSMFLENRVTNWTLTSSRVRRALRVGVAYGTDPRAVMDILTESAARHGLICREPAPFAIFEDFGENALIFCLYFWVDMRGPANSIVVASDLRMMIEKRLAETGIGVPYPQRDMHLTTDRPIRVEISNTPA
jgi:small-conductance mechanosensitive channel